MYLLDTYVPKIYERRCLEEEWERFKWRARKVDDGIRGGVYRNFVDYCFVGSTVKFQKIDI